MNEIGIIDTIRFLNQFRAGTGNYTAERQSLFQNMTVRDIMLEIKAMRSQDHGQEEIKTAAHAFIANDKRHDEQCGVVEIAE